ncbi:hypothetical protein OEZ85_005043 [Tetradesmus obliquus]|uniref:Uncharacterized protein n=1 Tax=Tetradesmus obliquus TaxID=3088 RepID=A0ABY8UGM6_TETOB|nr:hypothetical protein OEZ85_005043 [Tetradesmus obliquus]
MAVLQELAASAFPNQLPVLLLWSFRQRHELEMLCPPLLALAGALRLQLTTRLFYTGNASDCEAPSPPSGHLKKMQLAAASSSSLPPPATSSSSTWPAATSSSSMAAAFAQHSDIRSAAGAFLGTCSGRLSQAWLQQLLLAAGYAVYKN